MGRPMLWTTTSCALCSRVYQVKPHELPRIYCSRACRDAARRKRIIIVCGWCGRVCERLACLEGKARYCSKACADAAALGVRGIGNTFAWRGDNVGRWAHHKRAQKVIERTRCMRCDHTTRLVIHHQDENPANNSLENLEVLCRACHARHHHERVR
jgi:hypothetical protein